MSKFMLKVLFAAVILTLALGLLAAPAVVTPAAAGANTVWSSQPVQSYPQLATDPFPVKPFPGAQPCGYTWAG